jgi:hypothetical protein
MWLSGVSECERSETRRPIGFQGGARTGLLGAGSSPNLINRTFRAERPEGEARKLDYYTISLLGHLIDNMSIVRVIIISITP